MKLAQLLRVLGGQSPLPGRANSDLEVKSICFDSRKLEDGCVFVAIRGAKSDGHDYLPQAVASGAIALVIENSGKVPKGFPGGIVRVPDSRRALNQLAAAFYGSPSERLFSVGVTGTNGKTTIVNMIEAILNRHGCPTGVIGTIDLHLGSRVWPTELTTPDPLSLQRTLSEFLAAGAGAVAMEISSIGLEQSRSDEVEFDVAIFTNLSRDHLDFHGDMEAYFLAKRKLFADLLKHSTKRSPLAIINADDEYGQRLLAEKHTPAWGYGMGKEAALQFSLLEQGFFGNRFELSSPRGSREIRITQPGLHNVYNAVAAIGAGLAQNVPFDDIIAAIGQFQGVKGRLQVVPNSRGLYVFVDYAHTDGAIETVLRYLGQIRDQSNPQAKIITVFGCGGDRDRGKRPFMMKAASEGSDLVVVTSDNPRSEDPQAIVDDALKGAKASDLGKRVFPVLDRKDAIAFAVTLAKSGDVILIAGKGHETYQQIGQQKHPFSDVEVAQEILR